MNINEIKGKAREVALVAMHYKREGKLFCASCISHIEPDRDRAIAHLSYLNKKGVLKFVGRHTCRGSSYLHNHYEYEYKVVDVPKSSVINVPDRFKTGTSSTVTKSLKLSTVVQMLERGKRVPEVAEELGVDVGVINRFCNSYGLKLNRFFDTESIVRRIGIHKFSARITLPLSLLSRTGIDISKQMYFKVRLSPENNIVLNISNDKGSL